MNKILIITQNYNVGGLETHIKTVVDFLHKQQYEIYLATSENANTSEIDHLLSGKLQLYSWNLNRDNIIKSVEEIKSFIDFNNIDIAFIHPFESFIIGSIACLEKNIPYYVFVHGPINVSNVYGYHYIIYLKNFLLPNASRVFCVSKELQDIIKVEFNIDATVFLNPIDVNLFKRSIEYNANGDFLFVGRLDEDKAQGLKEVILFIDYLKRNRNDLRSLNIVGDGNAKTQIIEWIDQKISNKDWINFKGFSNQVKEEIENSSVVFGMGRVVLEACALKTPIVLTGYDNLKGLITENNFDIAAYANFSGRRLPGVSYETLVKQLVFDYERFSLLEMKIHNEYSIDSVSRLLLNALESTNKVDYSTNMVSEIHQFISEHENFAEVQSIVDLVRIVKEDTELSLSGVESLIFNLEQEFKDELTNIKSRLMDEKHNNNELKMKIANLQSINKKLIQDIEDLENKIVILKEENKILDQYSRKLQNELFQVYGTKIWKLARPYYNYRNRRTYLNRAINYIKKNGIKSFITAVSKKTKNKVLMTNNSSVHRKQLQNILKKNKGKKVIIFPPLVDWNIPLYQRPQHIALNLAENGYLYFFCTANMQYDNIDGFKQIGESCYVTNRFDLLNNEINSKILHLYSTDMNPHQELIDETIKSGNKILYEYIDEIHEDLSGPIPAEVKQKHERLLKDEKNCIVIASADKLYQEVLSYRLRNTALVTNGVEYEHFHITKDHYPVPNEIKSIVMKNKPIIGYFGAFATWFDYELVIKLATERPEYEILLIGWDYDKSIEKYHLEKYPNITVIGPINYKELPKYAIHFTVSTIPFVLNDITESTSPIKLFEYMALGHPIVTTNMPECRKYDSVLIGKNHDEFISMIDEALVLYNDKSYMKLLEKEALENTWGAKAKAIYSLLENSVQ